jgi:subtilisin family serine protease
VQIAAIGRNFSTDVHNGMSLYRLGGGTSDAAPVVTGIAALVLSVRPGLNALELKRILMESSKKLPSLAGKIASGGLVDAYAAVTLAMRSR